VSFINADHPGLAYGDGYMSGAGTLGQVVKVAGNDLFAVNTDDTARSFGILRKDYADGKMPGIWCGGGVYTTDIFEGTVNAGDALKVSANGVLTAGVEAGDVVIAEAISVVGGVLKFKLLI
jgi:hypothetical protein